MSRFSVLVACLFCSAALAQTPGPRPSTVTASATARVYRTPDYLDVVLGVVTLKTSAGEAHKEASTRMEAIVAALKGLNLAGAELQTGTVDLSPQYTEYRQGAERQIVSYEATNMLRVRTTDLKAVAKLIDTAMKAGANRVDSVEFGLKEYLAAREEALGMAAKAAKRKASVLVAALDAKLGRIVSLSESSPTYYYANRLAQVQSNVGGEGGPPPGEGAFEPGKVEVLVTVTIECEIGGA